MAEVPYSPSSPVRSADIPTTTNIAYELTKQGGAWDNRHEYELIGATSSPASKSVEGVYEIPSLPSVCQPHPVLPAASADQ